MKYRLYQGQGGYMGFEREDGLRANPPEIVNVLNNQHYRIDELQTIATLLTSQLEALRHEVRAWRDWHNKEPSISIDEPLLYQAAINATKNTDTLNALEDDR
jgi:hypothetical protein